MMVYSTQNYRAFGLFSMSGVLGRRNTTFRSLDVVAPSDLLEVCLARSKGPNRVGVFSPLHLMAERDPVSETSCFYSQKHRTMEKVQNPSNSMKQYSLE
jgi:hypothetical protein